MVHILSNQRIDIRTMSMLYNMISNIEKDLYLLTDTWYSVPQHELIQERAFYWFNKVHLIVGQPWHLYSQQLDNFDSVSIRLVYNNDTIFTPYRETEYHIKRNKLLTKTAIIGGKREDSWYKSMIGVQTTSPDYPFQLNTLLMDEELKIYDTLESRIGDL